MVVGDEVAARVLVLSGIEDPGGGRLGSWVAWRLVSGNNREMGRSAVVFEDLASCLAGIEELQNAARAARAEDVPGLTALPLVVVYWPGRPAGGDEQPRVRPRPRVRRKLGRLPEGPAARDCRPPGRQWSAASP